MKTTIERIDARDIAVSQDVTRLRKKQRSRGKFSTRLFSPAVLLLAMVVAILLLDAVLPLRDLWFHDALLTQMGAWPAWPSLLLLPGWAIIPHLPNDHGTSTLVVMHGWATVPMLAGAFVLVFLVYLLALRRLPGSINWRFIKNSTILIGCLYVLIPVVTSPDLFSYIAYARMGVLHDLNPLTTIPTAIRGDPIYTFVFWVDQPSAYGPTWAIITSLLQGSLAIFGNTYIMPMVLALRLLGLAMHLVSARLIWSISGQLQQLNGQPARATRKRLGATLAFAWNPLLLFEACVNAHNDTVLLVFVLLAIWILGQDKIRKMHLDLDDRSVTIVTSPAFQGDRESRLYPLSDTLTHSRRVGAILAVALKRWHTVTGILYAAAVRPLAPAYELLSMPIKKGVARIPHDLRAPVATACLLALGTCLKVNAVLLFPGLLGYIWVQAPSNRKIKHVGVTLASYVAVIVLFYAPFWQGGAIFDVFQVNPATYRSINTLAEFLAHSYNSIAAMFGYSTGSPIASPAERFMHTFSMGIFVLLYLVMLWRTLRAPWRLQSLRGMIYWLAVVWLFYCAIGSPWYWPWYIVTFIGLFALLEASDEDTSTEKRDAVFPWNLPFMRTSWTARLLSFSMLTMYCFMTGPMHSFIQGLPGFEWSDFTGAWGWLLPLVGIILLLRFESRSRTRLSHKGRNVRRGGRG
ncbi:MAG TPA: hypothetical protein VNE38_13665 [Ktedonobacteraceae bacterium]|nr:hypothetical protein [Ktedonobacteraceae bacterium]